MEHFVSVAFPKQEINEQKLVETMLGVTNKKLVESGTLYELYESDKGQTVMQLALPNELTEAESDLFAKKLASRLFDQGHDNFDIYVSLAENSVSPFTYDQATDLGYDVIEDVHTFMRNDPDFYRKEYFPTMSKLCDSYKQGNTLEGSVCVPMVKKAFEAYRRKFGISEQYDHEFNEGKCNDLVGLIMDEESEAIREGEY